MAISNLNLPQPPNTPIGLSPFSPAPTTAAAVQAVSGLSATNIANLGSSFVVAGAVPFTIVRFITNAEFAALNATPIVLLPVAGVGFRWVPWLAQISVVKTVASGGPAPTLRIRYSGTTVDLVTAFATDVANSPRSWFNSSSYANPPINSTTIASLDNLALSVDASSGIGASNATVNLLVTVSKVPVVGYA